MAELSVRLNWEAPLSPPFQAWILETIDHNKDHFDGRVCRNPGR
jgi:hypothetical protein